MKQVISHRGAAGLGLENSVKVIKKALAMGNAIPEIDIRLTADKKLVVCHDADLKTMANDDRKIADLTWEELKQIPLKDGSRLLRLEKLLTLADAKKIVIEVKETGCEEELVAVLGDYPKTPVTVVSFKRAALSKLRELKPSLPLYALDHTNPNDALHFASRQKLKGIGVNFWLMNPFTYHQAQRANLEIFVYTVNNRFFVWFLGVIYPNAMICTDHPERFK